MSIEQTVFIVDDDEAYRDSVSELLSSVGIASLAYGSALEFLQSFDPARPGCLVLDVRMMRMSGIALQAKLRTMGARLPIVFISGFGDVDMAVKAIKDGAVDFVRKPYREQHLLDAIEEALRRDAAWRSTSHDPAPGEQVSSLAGPVAALTEREREVMALALAGVPSKLIARQLSLSHRTVEHHRSRLLEKLGVGSIIDLMCKLREDPGISDFDVK